MINHKLILPILFMLILLSPMGYAQLTFDDSDKILSSGSISGITTHDNKILVSVYLSSVLPRQIREYDTSFNLLNTYDVGYNGILASDGEFVYLRNALNSRIYKLNPENNYTELSNNYLSGSYFDCTFIDFELWCGKSDGEIVIYDYDSNSVKETITIIGFESYAITHISPHGENVYIGNSNGEFLQINKNNQIIEEPLVMIGQVVTDTRQLMKASDDKFYYYSVDSLTTTNRQTLYRATSDGVLTQEYVFLDSKYYSPIQCIDTGSSIDYVLCNQSTQYEYTNYVVSYCDSPTYESVCSECVTQEVVVDGKTYVYGECDDGECVPECYTIGSYQCLNDRAYQTCFMGENNCPQLSDVSVCDTGEVCRSGVIGCETYDYGEFGETLLTPKWFVNHISKTTQDTRFRDVDSIDVASNTFKLLYNYNLVTTDFVKTYNQHLLDFYNLGLVSYYKNNIKGGLKVDTTNKAVVLKFNVIKPSVATNTSSFVGVNCDYKESNNLIVEDVGTLNESYTLTNVLNYNNLKVLVNTLPSNTSNATLYIYNNNPHINIKVDIVRLGENILIYQDGVLVVDDTTPSSDTLVGLSIYCDASSTTQFYGCTYKFNRNTPSTYHATPRVMNITTPSVSNRVSLDVEGELELFGYHISQLPSRTSFVQSYDYTNHVCSYPVSDDSEYKVIRFYHSYDGTPFYNDFIDTTIQLNTQLVILPPLQDSTSGIFDISPQTKMLLAIGVLLLVFIIMLVFGFAIDNVPLFVGIGGSLVGVGLIIFSIIGFIPLFVSVVIIILTIMVFVITMSRRL